MAAPTQLSLSVNSSNSQNRLYTTLLDWTDDAPTAHDIFSAFPDKFSAILEDPSGGGRNFLVSKQGVTRCINGLDGAAVFINDWKSGISGVNHDFPGIRQLFYAAYEAGRVIESLPEPKTGTPGPMLWLLEPEWSICIDYAEHKLYLASRISQQQLDEVVDAIIPQSGSAKSAQGEAPAEDDKPNS